MNEVSLDSEESLESEGSLGSGNLGFSRDKREACGASLTRGAWEARVDWAAGEPEEREPGEQEPG